MRKYLLPSALILAFGLALASAQNINKAIQLSQDPTGAFGVDTNNNSYWPGHFLSTGPGVPVLGTCGTTPSILGTDSAGQITAGTTTTNCTITFNKAYLAAPWCVVTAQSGTTNGGPGTFYLSYSTTVALLSITQTSTSSNLINYVCMGSK